MESGTQKAAPIGRCARSLSKVPSKTMQKEKESALLPAQAVLIQSVETTRASDVNDSVES
jgi:hypothetical protein